MLALGPTASVGTASTSTATKRLGSLLALRVQGVLWMGLCAPTVATEGARGKVGLRGAVDKPKDRGVTLISLKCSSAVCLIAEQAGAIKGQVHETGLDIP